ncbi:MAG: hypothetical protein OIF50_07155 [Flavobacteriaceae bacterium]|nr:hypothetical protein [Flavobacteriaceae bacterium]
MKRIVVLFGLMFVLALILIILYAYKAKDITDIEAQNIYNRQEKKERLATYRSNKSRIVKLRNDKKALEGAISYLEEITLHEEP